jgi:beta-lactam-binding protein with PASTA domain
MNALRCFLACIALTAAFAGCPRTLNVPAVVGQPLAAAQAAIVGAGLVVGTISEQASDTVAAGVVISQTPAAGAQVSAGSAVNLIVSTGGTLVNVPGVAGQTLAAAQAAIEAAGLVVGSVTEQDSVSVAVGAVISQNPAAGAQASAGSAVDLVVSTGSGVATVSVPAVGGQTLVAAQAAIEGAGLTLGTVTEQSSDTVAEGAVVSQSPAAGVQATVGSTVDLVISTGSALVSVPAVGGQSLAAAQAAIVGAGLVVGTITYEPSDTVAEDAVISQSPAAGVQASAGSAVDLVVSTGSASSTGKISGWVKDAGGTPLPGVLVRLERPTKSGVSATTTNVDGFYHLEEVPAQDGFVLRFSRNGFTPNSQYIDIIADVTTSANTILLALSAPETISANAGATLENTTTGAKLTLPPNALVTAKGPVTGEVSVQLTALDITVPDQLAAFPGNFRAVELGKSNDVVTLETFGLVDIRLTQDLGKSTEAEVQLAPGVTALIEIPLQPDLPASEHDNLRLWWFNEETAIWEEELLEGGVAAASSGNGLSFYAEISHFSWWNCDAPLTEKACVRGRVVDGAGAAIAGASVEARGLSYDGSTYGTTNAGGWFCLDVKALSEVEVKVTLPGGYTPMAVQQFTSGDPGNSCTDTGNCSDLGDIAATFDSCVRGSMRDSSGGPLPGITVYSSVGTTAVTDGSGEFCLETPGGVGVSVFAPGVSTVTVTPPVTGTCSTGCAEVELTTIALLDGARVGRIAASSRDGISGEEGGYVVASFITGPSEESLGSLVYFDDFDLDIVDLVQRAIGSVDAYRVAESPLEWFQLLIGCADIYDFMQCLLDNLNSLQPVDPGAPGAARFPSGNTLEMVRLWEFFENAFGEYDLNEHFLLTRLRALSWGRFVSANVLGNGGSWKSAEGAIEVSWPGGVNIGAFTATLPAPPPVPVFIDPVITNGSASFDGNDFTFRWVPEAASMSVIIFVTSDDSSRKLIIWAIDDGEFSVPAAAFAAQPTVANVQAFRLVLDTVSVPFADGSGNGVIQLESVSHFNDDWQNKTPR